MSGEVSVFDWLAAILGQLGISPVPGSLCPSYARWTWVGPAKFSFEQTSLPLQAFLSSRGFSVRCCIVVKHLRRSELGTGDCSSQSPPVKRPCPDVQVSLVLLCPPLGSNWFLLFAQEVPDVLLSFLIKMQRIWEQS